MTAHTHILGLSRLMAAAKKKQGTAATGKAAKTAAKAAKVAAKAAAEAKEKGGTATAATAADISTTAAITAATAATTAASLAAERAEGAYRKLRLQIAVMGGIALVLTFGLAYLANLNSVENLRDGCGRNNKRVQISYGFYSTAASKVNYDTKSATGQDRQHLQRYASKLETNAAEVVAAVPLDLRVAPNSPQTNCGKAFPKPWPL